jgi:hypothetical protein
VIAVSSFPKRDLTKKGASMAYLVENPPQVLTNDSQGQELETAYEE